jgi:sulfonate transport system substrate-binding protein
MALPQPRAAADGKAIAFDAPAERRSMEGPVTNRFSKPTRRALVTAGASGAMAGLFAAKLRTARAAPVPIRYATGGGIGPNEMETIIYLDWMQKNVLQGYGKDYTLDMTFTRGTPEAGTLLAAGQVDMATLSFAVFATSVLQNIVPGGLTIISDNYQDGRPGYAQNTFFVLKDAPIQSTHDLKGKKVGINAFGSAVDLALRVKLKKDGIDPRKDLTIVEVGFPNQAAAIREKRIDCGILILPFMSAEIRKGDLRALFTGGDAFGSYSVIFQVVTNEFLKSNSQAVKSFLADYVRGLQWFYDPGNRRKAIEVTAEFTKSPADVLDSYFMTERDYYRDRNGCVSVAAIQAPIDAMHNEGFIDRAVKVSDHLDMSYLPFPCSA